MEGRWTIHVAYDNGDVLQGHNAIVTGPPVYAADPVVPVVPCDDAAIERAAEYLFPSIPSPYTDEDAMRFARDLARGTLRAAGETP